MIFSMTGFASTERAISGGILLIELRSVNHRYLELHMKLDDTLRHTEPLVRELISARLGRGKVECRMSLVRKTAASQSTQLDTAILQQLAQMTAGVQQHFPQSQPLTVADILRWPGVIESKSDAGADPAESADALVEDVRSGIADVLQQMADMRSREGAKLKALILERLAEMETLVAQVKPLLPLQIRAYQERLTAKFQEVMRTVDDERVRQELVLFAQRVDVDEELTRLTAHMQEVKRILDADTAAGKRLDFLMQELNREANTLGSKSISTESSQVAMGLKILIEQMREQIQNVE